MNKNKMPYNLPTEWLWTTVGEIGIITSGGTPSTRNTGFWGNDVAWITPADMSNYKAKYISKGARNITQAGLDYSSAKLLPTGSVLFSSRAPIGYVVIARNELATNQGFKNLIPTRSLYGDYVYYYFKTIKPLAEKMASGTTFLELSAAKFSQIPFPLPPLNEQHRIVAKIEELFSELDHAEEGLKTTQGQLEIYRKVLLKKAFLGELTKKRIKKGGLPTNWKRVAFNDFCELQRGYDLPLSKII
jgi:type I restriction enzyme, S subunit